MTEIPQGVLAAERPPLRSTSPNPGAAATYLPTGPAPVVLPEAVQQRVKTMTAEIDRVAKVLTRLKWARKRLIVGEWNRQRLKDPVAREKFIFNAKRSAALKKLPEMTRPQKIAYNKLRYDLKLPREKAIEMAMRP